MEVKYALVHEWLTPKATGGSELVVKEILKHINADLYALIDFCLLYTSPSPRDNTGSRMPSSA